MRATAVALATAAAICVSTAASARAAAAAGQLYGAGENSAGQLGNGTTQNGYSFVANPFLPASVIEASPSYQSTLYLLASGMVDASGSNKYGELGDGTTSASYAPTAVGGISAATAVAAGAYSGYALLDNGTVDAWGYDYYGQLGNGSERRSGCECSTEPSLVSGIGGEGSLENVVAVSGGYESAAALLSNGHVVTWGYGGYGELGNGAKAQSNVPVEVLGVEGKGRLEHVVAISAYFYGYVALLSNGRVVAWGDGTAGELGNGSTAESDVPVEVLGVEGKGKLEHVVAVSGGGYFNVALLTSGEVVSWGYGVNDELGNGRTTTSAVPVKVVGVGGSGYLSGVTSVTAGTEFALATTSSHALVGWGYALKGELGLGGEAATQTQRPSPVDVPGLSGVVSVGHGDSDYTALAVEGAFAQLSTASIGFANQTVGTMGSPQSVALRNEGPAPLSVSGVSLSGSSAFSITANTCSGTTIAVDGTCSVSLTFAPLSEGSASASLSISSSAANALGSVSLAGTGTPVPAPTGTTPTGTTPTGTTPTSSNPLTPAAPAPTLAPPTPTIRVSKASEKRRKLAIELTCGGAACNGTATLTAKLPILVKRKGKQRREPALVTIATGRYSLAAGRSETIALELDGVAASYLESHAQLHAKLVVRVTSGALATESVKLAKSAHRRKRGSKGRRRSRTRHRP